MRLVIIIDIISIIDIIIILLILPYDTSTIHCLHVRISLSGDYQPVLNAPFAALLEHFVMYSC
jgi:hypothetical protein